MRILFGSDTFYPNVNGASYFTQRLAAGLRENGDDVHVICPSQSMRSNVIERDRVLIHGVTSMSTPLYAALRFSPPPFIYNQVFNAVKRIKPDVIHIQDHFFIGRALTRVARKLDIPILATNHFVPENVTAQLQFLTEKQRRVLDKWIWRDLKVVYNRVEMITTPTSVGARILKDKGIIGAVPAVSCGVDLSRFNTYQNGKVFRDAYKILPLPTYMYVGRLDKEKHVDELIKALPLVRREVDAQFIVVGSGKLRAQLVELAKRENVSDNVIFTGFVPDDDLPKAYAACDVFCNAGTAELQSIATLEAMATGKPVVAANAMALPILVHDGVNGYVFQPGDIETLANQLIALLIDRSKRKLMGQESLKIVATHRIENTLSSYRELYMAVIKSWGLPRVSSYDTIGRYLRISNSSPTAA